MLLLSDAIGGMQEKMRCRDEEKNAGKRPGQRKTAELLAGEVAIATAVAAR
jgi:hypothetical protein